MAHNGLRFDSKFLAATCRRHGLPMREVNAIDTVHMSKMLFGKTRGTGPRYIAPHVVQKVSYLRRSVIRPRTGYHLNLMTEISAKSKKKKRAPFGTRQLSRGPIARLPGRAC